MRLLVSRQAARKTNAADKGQPSARAPGDTVRALLDHRWVGMGVFILLLGAALRRRELMALAGFMLTIVGVSWLWSRASLGAVIYRRRFRPLRVFPGEEIVAELTVENRKLLPLGWLQIEDEWPQAVAPSDAGLLAPSPIPEWGFLVNAYALRWFERVRRRFLLQARARGWSAVGPAHLISGDPFNLFARQALLLRREHLVVYPRLWRLEEIGLPIKEPFGDTRAGRRLFEDPNRVMGVRRYQPGDSFRHVHWKATARVGELQMKVYEPTRSASLMLCLNAATFAYRWQGVWPEMLEYVLSVGASLARWAAESRYAVGVTVNGALAQSDQLLRLFC